MSEDEMYDIIRGYEESERDYHERNIELENENAKLRELLSSALISAGTNGRQFLDAYLQEEGTTLLQELRSLGIEVNDDRVSRWMAYEPIQVHRWVEQGA